MGLTSQELRSMYGSGRALQMPGLNEFYLKLVREQFTKTC